MNYPTAFAKDIHEVTSHMVAKGGIEALTSLQAAGFFVSEGLLETDVPILLAMAQQEAIREFCPNDASSRFKDKETVSRWLAKDGGRAMFILRHREHNNVAGYGWTGPGVTASVADSQTVFAIRLSASVTGHGLARPFAAVILAASTQLFGARNIALETWGSNTGAVKTYVRIGAELIITQDGMRPTHYPNSEEVSGRRRDVRLFMKFPSTFMSA